MLLGPDLLKTLYSFSADIEGMFVQVGVLPEDQHFLNFLGRKDPTIDVAFSQYTRYIFGATDSQSCAIFAMQRTAMSNQEMFRDAESAVLGIFYDDYLDSFESPDVAFKLSQELFYFARFRWI